MKKMGVFLSSAIAICLIGIFWHITEKQMQSKDISTIKELQERSASISYPSEKSSRAENMVSLEAALNMLEQALNNSVNYDIKVAREQAEIILQKLEEASRLFDEYSLGEDNQKIGATATDDDTFSLLLSKSVAIAKNLNEILANEFLVDEVGSLSTTGGASLMNPLLEDRPFSTGIPDNLGGISGIPDNPVGISGIPDNPVGISGIPNSPVAAPQIGAMPNNSGLADFRANAIIAISMSRMSELKKLCSDCHKQFVKITNEK